jgi:hypothetical protein
MSCLDVLHLTRRDNDMTDTKIETRSTPFHRSPPQARAGAEAHASPLETYQALDDACRGESPSPSQEKACKARDNFHIEKMGYCYVMDRLALKASGVRVRLTAASIANDRYWRFSDS